MNYKQIQIDESAMSRGTPWGERILDSVRRMEFFLHGNVLSIGCGDGLELEALGTIVDNVFGLDLSPDKVEIARAKGLKATEGRMEELPFKDKEFDIVWCSHTLEHAEDLDKALAEMQRVAKRAIIFVPLEEETDNPAHTSPISDADYIRAKIKGKIIYERYLHRMEQELVLVVDYKEKK